MKRQKNMIQKRLTQTASASATSSSEKEPGEIDLTSLPEKEFKTKVITMLMDLQRNMQEQRKENTEIKQALEGLQNRVDEMQETINGLENREQEHREADAERDKRISRNERILRELSDQSKQKNICIIGVPEEKEREKGIESVFEEIIAKNFPKLGEEMASQTTEEHRTTMTRDPRTATPRHIIIKMAKIKDKEKVLKAAREKKKVTYKGKAIRLSSDFSVETLQARREWHDILNAMKQKGLELRLLYPARISFKYEGGIKQFPDKQKLREFASHKPPLQGILQGLL
ncbi:LINE-1 retrotransposable element ORF1 protein [Manis javanica]|nr:LINE-1 retrotransposable element ORF1 protein [Manis javanica]